MSSRLREVHKCSRVLPASPADRSISEDQSSAPGWDQERLSNSRVLIAGCGALGTPVAIHLARAGVGHLTVVDHDVVELSNLNRQLAFTADDVGAPKAHVLGAFLKGQGFLGTEVVSYQCSVQNYFFGHEASSFDLLVAAVDSQQTRFEMAQVAHGCEIPFISQGITLDGSGGYVFIQRVGSACFGCFAGTPTHGRTPCGGLPITSPICGEVGSRAAFASSSLLMNIPFSWNLWRSFQASGESLTCSAARSTACTICNE